MREELSQRELNEIVYGKPPTVEAVIYDKEVPDTTRSREQSRRVTKVVPYIHLKCAREKAEIHKPLQESDRHNFPLAWKKYQEAKEHESRDVPDIRSERPSVGEGYAERIRKEASA